MEASPILEGCIEPLLEVVRDIGAPEEPVIGEEAIEGIVLDPPLVVGRLEFLAVVLEYEVLGDPIVYMVDHPLPIAVLPVLGVASRGDEETSREGVGGLCEVLVAGCGRV